MRLENFKSIGLIELFLWTPEFTVNAFLQNNALFTGLVFMENGMIFLILSNSIFIYDFINFIEFLSEII